MLNKSRYLTFNQHAPLRVFSGHFHFRQPQRRGFHGLGLTILVASRWAGKVSIWEPGYDPDVQWMKVEAAVFGTDQDVFIASCYVPPAGSPQVSNVRSLID